MTDLLTMLNSLTRPRLLMRAARLGLGDYRRERDLRRLLGTHPLPGPRKALAQLMEVEATHEMNRHAKDGTYSPRAHVEALIALLGELRLMRASQTGE